MKGKIKELDGFRIERLNPQETYPFILKRHYLHRIPPITWAFGLVKDNSIVGIITIGKPASPYLCDGICGNEFSSQVYELNRMFIEDGLPKNTASYFISRCLGYLRPPPHSHSGFIIVSYADSGKNHCGFVYQSSNWIYTGITKERTDINSGELKHSRHYDKNSDHSINRKLRTAKHRYVFFIGDKKFKRLMKEKLKYPLLPYPKLNPERYETNSCESQTLINFE